MITPFSVTCYMYIVSRPLRGRALFDDNSTLYQLHVVNFCRTQYNHLYIACLLVGVHSQSTKVKSWCWWLAGAGGWLLGFLSRAGLPTHRDSVRRFSVQQSDAKICGAAAAGRAQLKPQICGLDGAPCYPINQGLLSTRILVVRSPWINQGLLTMGRLLRRPADQCLSPFADGWISRKHYSVRLATVRL
eukprot:COSAG01_NODE_13389_length_1593_cov_1.113788_2_plen_189_part_00